MPLRRRVRDARGSDDVPERDARADAVDSSGGPSPDVDAEARDDEADEGRGVAADAQEPVAGGSPEAGAERESTSWKLEVGTEIFPGRSVFKRLGGGSMYEVYLVWDDWLHALMVAKLLRPNRMNEERARREMLRESMVLERLAHPMLVRTFGADLDTEYPHILLEHLEGDTLRRLVKRHGFLPMEQLLPLALHVTSALHYLKNREMVHLDVKPGNIVMSAPPRLIDLSIARSFEDAAALRNPIGTDAYMAPEQCAPQTRGVIGPPADVFGLGATLFHAAVGKAPFPRARGASKSEVPEERWPQLVDEPIAMHRDVAPLFGRLLLAMINKDPGARPTAAEVALELEPLIATLPTRVFATRRGLRAG